MKVLATTLCALLLCFTLFACSDDDKGSGADASTLGPDCQTTVAHYYSQGCTFAMQQFPLAEVDAIQLCEDVKADARTLAGSCPDAFTAYFECVGAIAAQDCNACESELTALGPCVQ